MLHTILSGVFSLKQLSEQCNISLQLPCFDLKLLHRLCLAFTPAIRHHFKASFLLAELRRKSACLKDDTWSSK